ncbi:excisionase family DNA-binding protein [Robbsia sp. Bb-Pol-6]|uniref:Excisionase family DNA-binding protein n=1 Tax=Robbsia betulipollinis TaxID=2981849 RepID=A0ABT3ZRK5_9BURK|nr:GAF domain-containing protein [Robbsia betulipollinis]MCY0388518.1 excisionase family DNA-binding protein [Robbsia betulipollinis]
MPPSTDDPILTTRRAAELLGVSVRTAQNWIETGALGSWKTPGGHRRIRRSAVQAMLAKERKDVLDDAFVSAEVIVLAAPAGGRLVQDALAPAGEFLLTLFEDAFAALLAVGASSPALFIIEVDMHQPERLVLLQRVLDDPVLGHLKMLAISSLSTDELVARCGGHGRLSALAPADVAGGLAAWVRGALPGARAPATSAPAPDATIRYPLMANEASRAAAVDRSGLLDTLPEASFDHVTWLAGHLLKMPMAVLSLLASDRQWFKSRVGVEEMETSRDVAFCNHTIMQKGVFLVEDATLDARFVNHPMVRGAGRVRFYAGAPVVDDQGYALGALCVLHPEPRTLDAQEERALVALANVASSEIRLRIQGRRLRSALSALAGDHSRLTANANS